MTTRNPYRLTRRLLHTAALVASWVPLALFFAVVGAAGAAIGTAKSILDVWSAPR